ncbi:MAG: MoaD/ThiS family protein [Planctomycetota bacterium]|nr:MoaD/ThiS family protein [Planctomycetota bacterium]
MAHVAFTPHLSRYFPDLRAADVEADTVAGLVAELERAHPGLASYLVDERGRLRQHVNVFVDGHAVRDRERLLDALGRGSQVYVVQALSGG